MAIFDLYSRRRAASAKSGRPDVYAYDKLPAALLNQVVMIWRERVAPPLGYPYKDEVWGDIEGALLREFGFLGWPTQRHYDHDVFARLADFFISDKATNDQRLDMIEFVFGYIERRRLGGDEARRDEMAIAELNVRFQQASVGYGFERQEIIRVDSTFTHGEMVKPALTLLGTPGFERADEHFRAAHKHYRNREFAAAITEAGKAFEAALKAICKKNNWTYPAGAAAGNLVTVVVNNGLFPQWLADGLTAYVAMMKTGLPSVRNQSAAHGAAPDAEPVHEYFARYALHLSASNLLLVMEAAAKRRS